MAAPATQLPSTVSNYQARVVDRRRMVAISQGKVVHNFTLSLEEWVLRATVKKDVKDTDRIDMYPKAPMRQDLWFNDEDEVVFMRRVMTDKPKESGPYRQLASNAPGLHTQDNMPYAFSLFNGLQLRLSDGKYRYHGLSHTQFGNFSAERQSFYALRDFEVVCISRARGTEGSANRDGTRGTGQTAFAGQDGGTHSITWYSDEIGPIGAWVRVALPPWKKEESFVPMGEPGRLSFECEGRTERRTCILKVLHPLEISNKVAEEWKKLEADAAYRKTALDDVKTDISCNVFTFERVAFFLHLKQDVAVYTGGLFPATDAALSAYLGFASLGAMDAAKADMLYSASLEGLQNTLHRHTLGKLLQFCRPGEKTDIYLGKSRTISG